MSVLEEIPIVSLSALSSGNPQEKQQASQAILRGFGHFGLVYLREHEIDPKRLDAFYDAFLAFTARPDAEKQPYGRADLWYQRGWTPPNTEKAVVAQGQPDFKECWFAATVPTRARDALLYPQIYAENLWPEDGGVLREHMTAVGQRLHEIGLALLRGCAQAFSLPENTFTEMTEGGPHVTRALRYLPLDEELVRREVLWGEEHTDFNLLTLLPGGRFLDPHGKTCAKPDNRSGLYLRTRPTKEDPRGKLVSGTPPAGCIVAQVGQQLELLTGGQLLATPHVITAPGVPGYSRASMAHFVHVHTDRVLAPLPKFETPETLRAYGPPVLAGTYGIKTLVDIGLAPKEALERLGYRHYDRLAEIRKEESATRG